MEAEALLADWFGPLDPQGFPSAPRGRFWFGSDTRRDRRLARDYGGLVAAAAGGALADWAATPRGRLALILLCDQLPRNLYRATPRAFALDPYARRHCLAGLDQGHDLSLAWVERAFFYLPLEHSERLRDQVRSLRLHRRQYGVALERAGIDNTHRAGSDARRRLGKGFLDSAREHYRIIERFGRFPHRNALLGRPSTPAEAHYLERSGRHFGQQPAATSEDAR